MIKLLASCLSCLGLWAVTAQAEPAAVVAAATCTALVARVAEIPGTGPLFLRSYDDPKGDGAPADPALATAAFTYDNALAVIALVACGQEAEARRLGEALLAATDGPAGRAPRLRNTYRAGAQTDWPPPPLGWWDEAAKAWVEDPYQVGTATGNVAWAGLALLTLAEITGEDRFRRGAASLGRWAMADVEDHRAPAGFSGGVDGEAAGETRLGWKSTEHNVDLAALFGRLAAAEPGAGWAAPEALARGFVASQWQAGDGHFLTGTLPDGTTPNRATSGLDAQLWPLLLPAPPAEWQRALAYAQAAHGVAGGFDFNQDRDGLWLEGTAQAALVYRLAGDDATADRLLETIAGQVSPGGLVWATREAAITTGLAIGPHSRSDDFRYYRQPHLAATAWTALAATGWNPFSGPAFGP